MEGVVHPVEVLLSDLPHDVLGGEEDLALWVLGAEFRGD